MPYSFRYQAVSNKDDHPEMHTNMDKVDDLTSDLHKLASSPNLSPASSTNTASPFLAPTDTPPLGVNDKNITRNNAKTETTNNYPSESLSISISSKINEVSSNKTAFSPSLSKFRRFIRFYGIPVESDATAVDTLVLHTTNVSTPKPSLPTLSPTSAAQYLIDAIDAENEDPFTLEPFEDLMKASAEKGKDFIFARVTTIDPSDESKFYFSYYAAHHINKVLFRTQPEEGLLHRMKAKNPLNNMTIIGDVHYYSISPEAFYSARRAASFNEQSSPISSTSRHSKLLNKREKKKSVAEKVLSSLSMMNKQDPKKIHLVIPNSSLESGNAEQFLERPRRPSADDIFHFISKSSKTKNHQSILDLESLGIHPHKITNTNPFSITPIESSRRKWSFSTSSAKKPEMTPQSPTILSAEDRITPRDLGFLNETSRLKRPSMTVEDWIRFHCDEPIVTLFSPTSSSPQDTQPKNTEVGSGLRRRLSKSSTFESHLNSPLPIIYEARFHSTDDDFLMKSSVRAYFKKNATEASDSLLFSIPASTTVLFSEENGLTPHPALEGFFLADEDENQRSLFRRFFQEKKLVRLVMLIYIVVGSLLIKFVIPDNLLYLFSFLLIFLLFIAFIFASENNSNQT